ncbi:TPA: hypothetical protein I9742_002938 [Serratia marcescens]|nr:hypothetical protein [Serratia marcescens]
MKKYISVLAIIIATYTIPSYAHAKIVIGGEVTGNSGTSIVIGKPGQNATGVSVGDTSKENGTASTGSIAQDIYASICASPFMKKYAAICQ